MYTVCIEFLTVRERAAGTAMLLCSSVLACVHRLRLASAAASDNENIYDEKAESEGD